VVTLYSGKCEGGPLRGLPLHHGETIYYVARSTLNRRLLVRNLATPFDDYEIGHYEFQDGAWHWRSPNQPTGEPKL
jgi:hypothetical protein